MADLVEALGVARASIYATFGSKNDLYVKALDRYLQARDVLVVEVLSQPGPVLPAVRSLVDAYVEEDVGADERRHCRGCMVVNAAVEVMARDPRAARRVESSWDTLETALASALTRAAAQGELPPEKDPRALSRFLLVSPCTGGCGQQGACAGIPIRPQSPRRRRAGPGHAELTDCHRDAEAFRAPSFKNDRSN